MLGNYQHEYETLSTFSNQHYYLRREASTSGSLLPRAIGGPVGGASGYIEFTSTGPSAYKTFKVIDTKGNIEYFSPNNTSDTIDGTRAGTSPYGIFIGYQSVIGDVSAIVDRFVEVINLPESRANIRAYRHSATIVGLVQGDPGANGDTAITWDTTALNNTTLTDFDGGVNTLPTPLPQTTNYMTLVGQAPYRLGNVFGVANNNRQPTTGSYLEDTGYATAGITFDAGVNPWTKTNWTLRIERETPFTGAKEVYIFKFMQTPVSNGYVYTETSTDVGIEVQVVNGSWEDTIINFWLAAELSSVFKVTIGGSNDVTIEEKTPGVGGTGGAITSPTSNWYTSLDSAFAGGVDVTIDGYDIVREIPRTDLTSSKHTVTTRFSAPGGPEVNSRGYLGRCNGAVFCLQCDQF